MNLEKVKPKEEPEPEWKPHPNGKPYFWINAEGHVKYTPPLKPLYTDLPYMGP